ncbi:MAG: penicillin-binding protein 1C [Alphaproteobacteria bacterium]|nr:penicillin-binding protein 1C [Alphaproteobacteria bacterium]
MKRRSKYIAAALALCCVFALSLVIATRAAMLPVAGALRVADAEVAAPRITDRNGQPLTVSYQNRWNLYDSVPLYALPQLLQKAFITSEDRRFYEHHGVDWLARASALWQDMVHFHIVRGASTITEQAVRLIHPRPRNLWSKWVEGFEAAALERQYTKPAILEFYLNQLPYAANRRGVAQAARYYFNRDLSTLSPKETLALAVLARAPSSYDLYRNAGRIDAAIDRLGEKLAAQGDLSRAQLTALRAQAFRLEQPELPVNAAHFAAWLRGHAPENGQGDGREIRSTLDAGLQAHVQKILDDRLHLLRNKNIHNAAALVVDHTTGDILAWVVAGAGNDAVPGNKFDAVTVPRQPGSSMKPLLYALALEDGWTPATIIDDAPLSEAIGSGLHRFKNYSNHFYGHITLREALANSLNIPALLTINHVGVAKYLATLHRLHFDSLDRGAQVYDEGLALGDGEVTLYELVRGYAALANHGLFRPLRAVMDEDAGPLSEAQVYSPEAASLIGNILSDPWARRLEFGSHSVLDFPVQTAVKTGTSTDYRDAWSVGFDARYVVGIWMGNLDQKPTDGITGSTGPALALRSIFATLNRRSAPRPLWLSPKLVQKDVCIEDAQDAGRCYMRSEYFIPGTQPRETARAKGPEKQRFNIVKPTDGLQMAVDPRIPQDSQKLAFTLHGLRPGQAVDWIVNGEKIGTSGETFMWPVTRGHYTLQARVRAGKKLVFSSALISYVVK